MLVSAIICIFLLAWNMIIIDERLHRGAGLILSGIIVLITYVVEERDTLSNDHVTVLPSTGDVCRSVRMPLSSRQDVTYRARHACDAMVCGQNRDCSDRIRDLLRTPRKVLAPSRLTHADCAILLAYRCQYPASVCIDNVKSILPPRASTPCECNRVGHLDYDLLKKMNWDDLLGCDCTGSWLSHAPVHRILKWMRGLQDRSQDLHVICPGEIDDLKSYGHVLGEVDLQSEVQDLLETHNAITDDADTDSWRVEPSRELRERLAWHEEFVADLSAHGRGRFVPCPK